MRQIARRYSPDISIPTQAPSSCGVRVCIETEMSFSLQTVADLNHHLSHYKVEVTEDNMARTDPATWDDYKFNKTAQAGIPLHFTFNSRWMPNFSMRLRSVARVMPSSLAACTWLSLVSLSAWMTSSRSTAGMTFSFGSRLAH